MPKVTFSISDENFLKAQNVLALHNQLNPSSEPVTDVDSFAKVGFKRWLNDHLVEFGKQKTITMMSKVELLDSTDWEAIEAIVDQKRADKVAAIEALPAEEPVVIP